MSNRYLERVFAHSQVESVRLRAHFGQMQTRSVEAGEAICLQDSAGPQLCLIAEGTALGMVEVRSCRESPELQPVIAYTEGMWLGANNVMGSYLGIVPTSGVQHFAATDLVIVRIGFDLARRLMVTEPKLLDFIMKLCLEEAVRCNRMMVHMKFGGPVHRVISGFSLLADSHAERVPLRAGPGSDMPVLEDSVDILLSQSSLGQLFGVSRSIISPILNKLAQEGWLELHYCRTTLLRPHAWQALAQRMLTGLPISRDLSVEAALRLLGQCLVSVESS